MNTSNVKKFNIDCLATSCLNAIGNTLLNEYELRLSADWIERSNLWTIHIGPSGSFKSHIFNMAIWPIIQKDRELKKKWEQENVIYDEFSEFCKSVKKEDERSELILNWLTEKGLSKSPEKTNRIECAIQNTTTEKVYQLLDDKHNAGRSVLVQYDEIAGLFKDFNKFHAGSDEESWLKFWNYFGLKKSRVSEDASNDVNETNVSIIGTTQIRAMYDIFTDNRVENGNVYRYLYTIDENQDKKNPFENLLENRDIDVSAEYYKMLRFFLEGYECSNIMRTTLKLDIDGYDFVNSWRKNMNIQNLEIETQIFNSIMGKMDSYIFRIAIILQRIRCYFDGCLQDNTISVDDLRNASEILNYYIFNTIYILGKIDVKVFQNFKNDEELKFYMGLTETFTAKDFFDKYVVEMTESKRTAERKLKKWCELKLIAKKSLGEYYKTA